MKKPMIYQNNLANLMTLSVLLTSPFLYSGFARAADQEEVPVEKVFVPVEAFNDSDNVVIRVEGTLPDPCYVLGNTNVRALSDDTFEVHQYATRDDTGVCSGNDDLYETSYSEDVSLGRLNVGDYKVVQHPSDSETTYRPFTITPTPLVTMSDSNYANVTQVSVPDVIGTAQEVKFTLSGDLASSCNIISDVNVERQGDVFVIRPIELQVGDCGYILKFFNEQIDLGQLAAGEYMIQVRTKGGGTIEHTFQVLKMN